jgi:hypothetical protein
MNRKSKKSPGRPKKKKSATRLNKSSFPAGPPAPQKRGEGSGSMGASKKGVCNGDFPDPNDEIYYALKDYQLAYLKMKQKEQAINSLLKKLLK